MRHCMSLGHESLNYVVACECPRASVSVSFVSAVLISQSSSLVGRPCTIVRVNNNNEVLL